MEVLRYAVDAITSLRPPGFSLEKHGAYGKSYGLIFEAAHPSPEAALDILPHPLEDVGVIVAVGEVVIERREAVLLGSFLHIPQLGALAREFIDVAPAKGCRIHRETRGNASVGDPVSAAGVRFVAAAKQAGNRPKFGKAGTPMARGLV